jgi:polyisoprenoid-binding protein YceI
LLFVAWAFTLIQNWQIGDNYNITFSTDGASGIFKKFSGNIAFDEQNIAASKFDIAIEVNSINTGNGLQNTDAKGADWFDAGKYPLIKYTSTKIIRVGTAYQATGNLQMHGVIKEITIPFTFQNNGNTAIFNSTFTINRNDFKIGKPDGDVGAAIKLVITVPVTKK